MLTIILAGRVSLTEPTASQRTTVFPEEIYRGPDVRGKLFWSLGKWEGSICWVLGHPDMRTVTYGRGRMRRYRWRLYPS